MDVNQAAMFLAGSLLIGISLIIIGGVVLILNNIFHKFWKPINIMIYHQPPRYQEENKIPPTLDNEDDHKLDLTKK